jgi:hypothetical protein
MSEQLVFGLAETGLTDYRSPQEREFLEALHVRAAAGGWYGDAWPRPNCITVSVIVDDPATGQLSKTLRVDFDGHNIAVGYDATHQLVDDSTITAPDEAGKPRSIAELAKDAADWIEQQLAAGCAERDNHVLELPPRASRPKPNW